MTQIKIHKISKISSKSAHSAFTDLLSVGKNLLCCYRQASNHVSGDGRLETTLLDISGKILCRQRLTLPAVDLRDPKLSLMPNGKIMLIAYARHRDANNKTLFSQSMCWFSDNGETWSSGRYFGPKNWWLWRIRWHQGVAYGLAYNRKANRVDLYKGHPWGNLECVKQGILSLSKHGKGYPNESDVWIADNGVMHALVRRDADSYSAMLGKSLPPYTRWQWHDLHYYVGGPVMQPLNQEELLVSGRIIVDRRLKTALWTLNIKANRLTPLALLPSAGDNSYPGMVLKGKQVYLSYYSMHQDNESRVYLADLSL